MIFNSAEPHLSLKPFIKCYWLLVDDYKGLNENIKILPNGAIEIIMHFKTPFQRLNNKHLVFEYNSFIEGQQTKSISLIKTADIKTFGISFYPWALKKLYNLKANEFTDKNYSISEIGINLENLRSQIKEAESFHKIKEVADLFFMKQVKTNKYTFSGLDLNIINLYSKRKFETLHSELSIGKRFLEKKTIELIGIPLGTVIKKNRITNCLPSIISDNKLSLTEIAYNGGYYDQAHFNRDIKTVFGVSPSFIRNNKSSFHSFMNTN